MRVPNLHPVLLVSPVAQRVTATVGAAGLLNWKVGAGILLQ